MTWFTLLDLKFKDLDDLEVIEILLASSSSQRMPPTHDKSLGIVKFLHVRISKLDHHTGRSINFYSDFYFIFQSLDTFSRKAHKKPQILLNKNFFLAANFQLSIIMERLDFFIVRGDCIEENWSIALSNLKIMGCEKMVNGWVKIVFHQLFVSKVVSQLHQLLTMSISVMKIHLDHLHFPNNFWPFPISFSHSENWCICQFSWYPH